VVSEVGDVDGFERTIATLGSEPGHEKLLHAGRLGRALVRERHSLARFADDYRSAIFGERAGAMAGSGAET
jgi:hypothetical protein